MGRTRNAPEALASEPYGISGDYGPRSTDHYRVLAHYYRQSRLYESLAYAIRRDTAGRQYSALKNLRNPAERAVEFHAALLWGGDPADVALETTTKEVADAIDRLWRYSNLSASGRIWSRWLPLYGDLFLKVVKPEGRDQVYIQGIRPDYITDFTKDDRGYFTFLRLDIPSERRLDDGTIREYCHTEIWKKGQDGQDGQFLYYEHDGSSRTPIASLPDPAGGMVLSAAGDIEDGVSGFDFIPFVHAKFRDVGDARGIGVYAPYLEQIDEANRMATRLHELLFRYDRAHRGLRSVGTDASGAPLPPPSFDSASRDAAVSYYASAGYVADARRRPDEVELGGERYLLLPASVEPVDLAPQIDYASGLALLDAQLKELSQNMPELVYYQIGQLIATASAQAATSGVALQTVMAAALDRMREARANLFAALERADEMALTIGSVYGVEGFTGIGSYEAGDFEHTISSPEGSASEAQATATTPQQNAPEVPQDAFARAQAILERMNGSQPAG
ncbi:hypothetical protein [Rubrobacter calidifluminis]|uniref:hypothetical protein n=1 Tax=Rubrobacter calidifluminis TaxID=1392640 RepID=UPI002361665D|nr:hypothetical protein [Rubrobacter calidifluminis]